jgi:hypothetical protein
MSPRKIHHNYPNKNGIFSYSKAAAALCKQEPTNEICTRMPPTAAENRRLSLTRGSFNSQITSANQLSRSVVRKGGKKQTKKRNQKKGKTAKRRYKQ